MSMNMPNPASVGFMEIVDLDSADQTRMERSPIERLCDQLELHEVEEAELLGGYEAAAKGSDPGVSFLMNLIVEDERRHHALMHSMAKEIRQSLLWLQGDPALPAIKASGETRTKLLAQTRAFLEFERSGVRDLELLEKQAKNLHSGLLELLIETMRDDTKKHARILEYIEKQLREKQS